MTSWRSLRIESATEGTNIRTATIYPAAINTELDALGITLDTDPRRSTRTGQDKPYQETPNADADRAA